MSFSTPVLRPRPLKSILVFRPSLQAETTHDVIKVLRLERKQKSSSNPFRIRLFLFLSYSFEIETINLFIHSRVSLENHTPFQNKMGKIYTRFQPKKAHKLYLMGYGTYLYGLYKGVPPPPPGVKGLENEVVWEALTERALYHCELRSLAKSSAALMGARSKVRGHGQYSHKTILRYVLS